MNSPGARPTAACVPTWRGHVETTRDALLIFEACMSGHLTHCLRRPHDRERADLIVSGNVFVYAEPTSGIKRWTDGVPWSPSRILTNFLIYRQLNSPFPAGEKKRAMKRNQRTPRPNETNGEPAESASPPINENRVIFTPETSSSESSRTDEAPDTNRGLVGSLVDSYEFKENGLLKKTMSVTVNKISHHLVSYYSLEDAKHNLKTPRDDPRLKDLPIRESLMSQSKFKCPNFDDAGDGSFDQMDGSQGPYGGYYQQGYDPSRMYHGQHHMAYATPGSQAYAYHPGYGHPHHQPPSAAYAHMPPGPASQPGMSPAGHYPQHQPQYYHAQSHPVAHYAGPPTHQGMYSSHHYYHTPPAPTSAPPSSVRSEPRLVDRTRPSEGCDYESSAHIETGNDVYGPSSVTSPASAESQPPMSQPNSTHQWPMGYSQQWGHRSETAPSYPQHYRQQS